MSWVRAAAREESAVIADVLREAFSKFASDYTPAAFEIVTPPAAEIECRFDDGPIWVAEDEDGVIVGTVSVVFEPERLYIRSMAVLPSTQGKGVGQRLLEAVEQYAVANGFEKLFLYTTHFSTGAIRLYEKQGFAKVFDTTADEWYGTPGLAMEKNIGRNIKQNVVGS